MIRGDVLRERRLALGFTQDDVAHFVGATQGAVARWESGERVPSGALMLQLCRLLRVDYKDLMT